MTMGRRLIVGETHKKHPKYMPDQRQFFDELVVNDWNDYLSPAWDEERLREVTRLFRNIQPSNILNVGCGSGFHDLLMAKFDFVNRVKGIDYSSKSIEVANREFPHEKIIREVSAIDDFTEDSYELVISFQVIEHLTNPEDFLVECKKRCVKGGWVAVFTPNRMRLTNRFRNLIGLKLVLEDPQHFAEYTVAELSEMGKKIGLVPIDHFSYNLTFEVPKFGFQLIPVRLSKHLGKLIPICANRMAVIYQNN